MGLYTNLIQTKIFSKIGANFVGEDEFGNKYYEEKLLFGKPQRAQKRWVIYKSGMVEASNVPPKWFSWLHYTSERALCGKPHAFEKGHLCNQTGGNNAYHPTGSLLNKNPKEAVKAPYESWSPSSSK